MKCIPLQQIFDIAVHRTWAKKLKQSLPFSARYYLIFFLDRKYPARGANVSVTRRWWVPFPPGIKLAWLWQLHPHSTTVVSAQATSHPTIFLPTLFSSWIEREKTWFPCPRMPPETISNLWRCRQKIHRRRNKPLSCRWRSMRFNARAERASDQWTWMSS